VKRRDSLLALPALALAPWVRAGAGPTPPGQPVAWPQQVRLLDGRPWAPAPGQAQIVVIWSTTCPFCQRHNAHVEKLHRALAGRPAAVLGVARDRDPAAVQRYLAANGYSFPVTLDWRALASVLSARNVIPLTVTVDRAGRLKQAIPGEMFEDDVLQLAALTT
jgi:thiol-disulfide isomerase/thioredoxin